MLPFRLLESDLGYFCTMCNGSISWIHMPTTISRYCFTFSRLLSRNVAILQSASINSLDDREWWVEIHSTYTVLPMEIHIQMKFSWKFVALDCIMMKLRILKWINVQIIPIDCSCIIWRWFWMFEFIITDINTDCELDPSQCNDFIIYGEDIIAFVRKSSYFSTFSSFGSFRSISHLHGSISLFDSFCDRQNFCSLEVFFFSSQL